MLFKTTQTTIPNQMKIFEFHLKGCCSLHSESLHAPSNQKLELSNEIHKFSVAKANLEKIGKTWQKIQNWLLHKGPTQFSFYSPVKLALASTPDCFLEASIRLIEAPHQTTGSGFKIYEKIVILMNQIK